MDKKTLKARISDAAGMPKDVVLGIPLVRVIGQNEMCIENYRGILEYTDKLVRVQTKLGKIHVMEKCQRLSFMERTISSPVRFLLPINRIRQRSQMWKVERLRISLIPGEDQPVCMMISRIFTVRPILLQ